MSSARSQLQLVVYGDHQQIDVRHRVNDHGAAFVDVEDDGANICLCGDPTQVAALARRIFLAAMACEEHLLCPDGLTSDEALTKARRKLREDCAAMQRIVTGDAFTSDPFDIAELQATQGERS